MPLLSPGHAGPAVLAVVFHALLLPPAMAQGAGWAFDPVYGAASVVALPGGQVTLVLDGAGQQARSINYTPAGSAAPISIDRAYGPGDRKAIESENGATRHHVYGAGLAPIMRTDSDGGFTYQAGLDTIVVDATGTVTVVHRVADLKHSTAAVLGDSARQPGQRVSYTSFGRMRTEKAGIDPDIMAALLAAYEGLTVYLLDSDQLVDNRARPYEPASGRFLALDLAGQAIAYEARGNNPVSRVDPDGNVNFDQLLGALENDRSIPIAFGDIHDSIQGIQALLYFSERLSERGIRYRIFQESNLVTIGPAKNKILNGRFQDNKSLRDHVRSLLDKGMISDLDRGSVRVPEAQAQEFRAGYAPKNNLKPDYGLFMASFKDWETSIPYVLDSMKRENAAAVFLFGASHFPRYEHTRHIGHPVIYNNFDVTEIAEDKVGLVPLSSFGLQSAFNLVTVVPHHSAHWYQQSRDVLSTYSFLLSNKAILPPVYQVNIPHQAFADHKALAGQYSHELLFRFVTNFRPAPRPAIAGGNDGNTQEKEEKDENDEEIVTVQHRQQAVRPMAKPEQVFPSSTFDEK